MKTLISAIIYLAILFACQFARGQDTLQNYRHKILGGYGYNFEDDYPKYLLGYSYLNKIDEVVRFSLTYYDFNTSISGLFLTVSYDIPSFPIKKNLTYFFPGRYMHIINGIRQVTENIGELEH
jgi:hypothetical protein